MTNLTFYLKNMGASCDLKCEGRSYPINHLYWSLNKLLCIYYIPVGNKRSKYYYQLNVVIKIMFVPEQPTTSLCVCNILQLDTML